MCVDQVTLMKTRHFLLMTAHFRHTAWFSMNDGFLHFVWSFCVHVSQYDEQRGHKDVSAFDIAGSFLTFSVSCSGSSPPVR